MALKMPVADPLPTLAQGFKLALPLGDGIGALLLRRKLCPVQLTHGWPVASPSEWFPKLKQQTPGRNASARCNW
jgi:hypothetical protein